jgi:hypothetical protein
MAGFTSTVPSVPPLTPIYLTLCKKGVSDETDGAISQKQTGENLQSLVGEKLQHQRALRKLQLTPTLQESSLERRTASSSAASMPQCLNANHATKRREIYLSEGSLSVLKHDVLQRDLNE